MYFWTVTQDFHLWLLLSVWYNVHGFRGKNHHQLFSHLCTNRTKTKNKQTNKQKSPVRLIPESTPKKWIGETPNFLEAVQERFVGYVMRAWRMKMKEWRRNPDIHTPRVPLPVPPGRASTIWLLVVAQADTRPFYRRTWNTASVLPGRPDSSRSSIGYRMAV